jgi:hypothetical protein
MFGLAWEVMVVVGGEEFVVCECEFGASRSCADGSDKLNASHVRSVYPGRAIGGVLTVRQRIFLTLIPVQKVVQDVDVSEYCKASSTPRDHVAS